MRARVACQSNATQSTFCFCLRFQLSTFSAPSVHAQHTASARTIQRFRLHIFLLAGQRVSCRWHCSEPRMLRRFFIKILLATTPCTPAPPHPPPHPPPHHCSIFHRLVVGGLSGGHDRGRPHREIFYCAPGCSDHRAEHNDSDWGGDVGCAGADLHYCKHIIVARVAIGALMLAVQMLTSIIANTSL